MRMRAGRAAVAWALGGLLLCAGILLWAGGSPSGPASGAGASAEGRDGNPLLDALSGDPRGFARAMEVRPFRFPRDEGPHPGFQTEWWYFTGNLDDRRGRHHGFQLTFFRRALSAEPVRRTSRWATREAWFAHAALAEVDRGTFTAQEKWGRGALDLAGARAEPFAVWVQDWSARADGTGYRLRADFSGRGLDLRLEPRKPRVLQGDRGLSRKGRAPGNASYYYSLPRLAVSGRVRTAEGDVDVTGTAWLDREWSTSALDPEDEGWDWFALHLSDGRDVMLYRLRRRDAGVEPFSSGSVVAPDGRARGLSASDFDVAPGAAWRSPRTGRVYPAAWRVRIPGERLDLAVEPWLADQELDLVVPYWEGAVKVTGSGVAGNGYVEMTGRSAATGADMRR